MARPIAFALGRVFAPRGAERERPSPRLPATLVVAGLRFALPRPALADVHVVDAAGRRVRTLACGDFPAGEHDCRWDGRDDQGARCAAGRYVLRLETGGNLLTSRVVALD